MQSQGYQSTKPTMIQPGNSNMGVYHRDTETRSL